MSSRRRRARAAVALAAVAALAAAGCARVPDHGSVHAGNPIPVGNAAEDERFRVIVHGPSAGDSPEDIVTGFLTASAGSETDHDVARTYLSASAARNWQPNARALIYDGTTSNGVGPARPVGAERRVPWRVPLLATVDADGGYTVAPSGAQVHVDFRLVREHGEWRIANPPPGLLLTPSELGRSLNQQFVYFLNRDLSVVVPDTVFLSASDPGLPTALMRVLLRGPTSWLVSAVRTAIPAGTTLRGPVTVDDRGTATVDLSQEVLDTTGAQREQLSAQIVWTLSGVPSITRVRLLAGGNPLNVPTVAEPQSRDAWPTFDPGALPPGSFGFYRNGSRVVSATGSRAPGWLDRHPTALADVAISPDLSFYAGLGPAGSGTTVYAGSIVADARPVFRASAPCTPPSWDEADDLWTVQLSPTPQVLLIRLGQPVVRVPAPELNGLAVRELRVSRDGTRVAVVASSGRGVELLVGRVSITGDGALRLDGFRSPSPGLLDVGDATWADANTVLVLARAPGHQRIPWLVDVDGVKPAPVTTSGLTSYTAAAGAPGQPTLVASGREIYQAKSGLWTPVGAGEDPGYPG